MQKQPEVTSITRQNIVDAFWSIYVTKKIDKISVREVMQKAGYNRGTFYEYFTDVYDVLNQIEESLLPKNNGLPFGAEGFLKAPHFGQQVLNLSPEEMETWTKNFFDLYQKSEKYLPILLGENGDPSFLKKIKTTFKEAIYLHPMIHKIQNHRELDIILEYNLSAMCGVMTYWFTLSQKPPLDVLLKTLFQLNQGTRSLIMDLFRLEASVDL